MSRRCIAARRARTSSTRPPCWSRATPSRLILADVDRVAASCAAARRRASRHRHGCTDAAPAGGADDVRREVGRAGSPGILDARHFLEPLGAVRAARRRGGDARRVRRARNGRAAPVCSRARARRAGHAVARDPHAARGARGRARDDRRRSRRRSAETSCCSRRPKWARSAKGRPAARRRCRTRRIPSQPLSP